MRHLLAATLAWLATSPAAAEEVAARIVVVGRPLGEAVADALSVELHPFGIEVRSRPDALASADPVRLDVAARFAQLEDVGARENALGVVEVMVEDGGRVVVLYLSRSDGVTRSRVLSVARPPRMEDVETVALVLRSIIRGAAAAEGPGRAASLDDLVEALPPSPPRVRVRGPATRALSFELSVGWGLWTRVGGDFVWHGPSVAVEVRPAPVLSFEAHAGLSLESRAHAGQAMVELHDSLVGLAVWALLLRTDRLELGVGLGVDGHRTLERATDGGAETLAGVRGVVVPTGGVQLRMRLTRATGLRLAVTGGPALGWTTYTVDGAPVLGESRWAVGATMSLAVAGR